MGCHTLSYPLNHFHVHTRTVLHPHFWGRFHWPKWQVRWIIPINHHLFSIKSSFHGIKSSFHGMVPSMAHGFWLQLGLPHRSCAHTLRCRVEAKLETACGARDWNPQMVWSQFLVNQIFEHDCNIICNIYIYYT